MSTPVTKAVLPAAGYGTRFLPQTKAMPKEMLPMFDQPVIQLIVEACVAAGVTDIIIVTSQEKRAIEDHFDRSIGNEKRLRKANKHREADEIKKIAEMANFAYIRQKGEPLGNARPLLNAAHLIGDEPFFYIFADDFFEAKVPNTVQMLEAFEKTGKSVMALTEITDEETERYGVIDPGEDYGEGVVEVKQVIEKPGADKAPSRLASVHGFLLTPDVLPIVERLKPTSRGEIEIQTANNELAKAGKLVGTLIDGIYWDAGTPEKYLKAVVHRALKDPDIGDSFRQTLQELLKK